MDLSDLVQALLRRDALAARQWVADAGGRSIVWTATISEAPAPVYLVRGEAPSASEVIVGCAFASRCPEVDQVCRRTTPLLESKRPGHLAACHFR